MRFMFVLLALLAAAIALPAAAGTTATSSPAPFAASALSDRDLAAVYGTGSPFRLTDEFAAQSFRQTGTLTATMKDLWLADVASPLIAANVRAARD